MSQKFDQLIVEMKGCREAAEELYLLFDHIYRNREELAELIRDDREDKPVLVHCERCSGTTHLERCLRQGWRGLRNEGDALFGICPPCNAATEKELPLERLFCTTCNAASPKSLAHALRDGWTCLTDDEGNERGNYAGHCPTCSEKLESDRTVTTCESCDSCCDDLSQAVDAGWTDLRADAGGLSWDYLGICPTCQAEQVELGRNSEPSQKNPSRTLFGE